MKTRAVLGFILLVAAVLRLIHYDFGLPHPYHPDEPISVQTVARLFQWHPAIEGYRHPPLLKYLACVGLRAYHLFSPIPAAELELHANHALRLVSVFFGVLAVYFTYRLARKVTIEPFALLAAGLLSVSPIAVTVSKYGVPDSTLTCLIVLTLLILVGFIDGRTSLGRYGLAGLFMALAFATKYSAVFLFIAFLVAHVLASRRAPAPRSFLLDPERVFAFIAAGVVGLMVGFPMVWFGGEWPNFLTSILYEKEHLLEAGHLGVRIPGREFLWTFHFQKSVLPSAGPLVLLFILGGLLLVVLRRRPRGLILLGMIVPYYVAMEVVYKIPGNFQRYVLPLVPLFAIAAAVFVEWLVSCVRKTWRVPLTIVLILALLSFPAYRAVLTVASIVPDTRDRMREWIAGNLPPSSRLLLPAHPGAGFYPPVWDLGYAVATFGREIPDYDAALRGADFVVTSSFHYEPFFFHPEDVPARTRFYRTLFEQAELLHEVRPSWGSYQMHNPTLRVYRLGGKGGKRD